MDSSIWSSYWEVLQNVFSTYGHEPKKIHVEKSMLFGFTQKFSFSCSAWSFLLLFIKICLKKITITPSCTFSFVCFFEFFNSYLFPMHPFSTHWKHHWEHQGTLETNGLIRTCCFENLNYYTKFFLELYFWNICKMILKQFDEEY